MISAQFSDHCVAGFFIQVKDHHFAARASNASCHRLTNT
jgi:hypothetical protein